MSVYIDHSFRETVRAHLLSNLITDVAEFPLMLGIFGPPGEGKTYQIGKICEELELRQHLLSPAELESENAGAPGQLLRRIYLTASADATKGQPGVLVIHDFDTIMGHWGNLVQYTVNRQVVYAQMMAFCDYPHNVSGQDCRRVPVVITGNDPSILHGPLLRPGRMRLMEWQPGPEMRAKIIGPLFPEIDPTDLLKLVIRFAESPVSFWADVSGVAIERRVVRVVREIGDDRVRQILSNGSRVRVSHDMHFVDEIAEIATELRSADIRGESYLSRGLSACRDLDD